MKSSNLNKNSACGLFVYGSLKREGKHHSMLVDLGFSFVTEAFVVGKIVPVDGEYFGLVQADDDKSAKVYGEIYLLPTDSAKSRRALMIIDEFEDFYPDQLDRCLYIRDIIVPITEDGKSYGPVWTYYAAKEVYLDNYSGKH